MRFFFIWISYGRGAGVGRERGAGTGLAVAVGVSVAVGVTVDVGVGVGIWIVAVSLVRKVAAAARVNIAVEGSRHQAVVGKWVVCRHGPSVCTNIVNLDVIIGCAGIAASNSVDFAVEVDRGVGVSRN